MNNLVKAKSFLTLSLLAITISPLAQATQKKCAFGDNMRALAANTRFESRDLMSTFKLTRIPTAAKQLLWVYVTEITDTKTKRKYQMNATGNDPYDGGSTVGWIEDVTQAFLGIDDSAGLSRLKGTGQVVASIGDKAIYCTVDVE